MCRFITQSELHHLSDVQLRALFNEVSRELHGSKPGTHKRRAALASQENIRRALAQRATAPRPKPPAC